MARMALQADFLITGPIENGANGGQAQYMKDLVAAVKAAVSRPRSSTGSGGGAKGAKTRKKGAGRTKTSQAAPNAASTKTTAVGHAPAADWGIFQPVQPILGPIVDIGKPLLGGNLMYGLLVGLLVAFWCGYGFPVRSSSAPRPYGDPGSFSASSLPDRIAAYEEMWRREESDLWDWLEERVGIDRLSGELRNAGDRSTGFGPSGSARRLKAGEARTIEERLRLEKAEHREVEDAIRVTEERLRVLQDMMRKKREQPAEG